MSEPFSSYCLQMPRLWQPPFPHDFDSSFRPSTVVSANDPHDLPALPSTNSISPSTSFSSARQMVSPGSLSPSLPTEILRYPSLRMISHTMTPMSNTYEFGYFPKFYNLSSYSLLSFLDVLSRDFLFLILLRTQSLKRETMLVPREDVSNLGQNSCMSVQNCSLSPGKVVLVHELSCSGSEFSVE